MAHTANKGGVVADTDNELAVSGTATPVAVASGVAVAYGIPYFNTASVNVAIATPASLTRVDYIVLRVDWAAQTVRITRVAGTEGAGTPALTQTAGTTWDIPLATVSITTGGVITVTDAREWLYVVGPETIVAGMLADDAVATANIQADAVTGTEIADYAIDPRSHISGTNGIVVDPQNGSARGTDAVDLQTVRGASGNVAAGNYSAIGGGHSNQADGAYSGVPMGLEAKARLHGQMAHSAGKLTNVGDAQHSVYVLRKGTLNATPAQLWLDGSSENLSIPSNSAWNVTIKVVARNATTPSQLAAYKFEGVFYNSSGSATILGSVTKTVLGEVDSAWDCDVTVSAGNIVITATGAASQIIYWLAVVDVAEVTMA